MEVMGIVLLMVLVGSLLCGVIADQMPTSGGHRIEDQVFRKMQVFPIASMSSGWNTA